MERHVSSTMQKGILVANVFQRNDTLFFAGLLSSLAATGTWLHVASYYGLSVSTTHYIVGSMVGFGLVYRETGAVFWSSLARATCSWVILPVIGSAMSILVYKFIRRFVYSAPNPGQAAAAAAPIAVFIGVTGISFVAFPLSKILFIALAQALAYGTVGAVLLDRIIRKQLGHLHVKSSSTQSAPKDTIQQKNIGLLTEVAVPKGTKLEIVYKVFGYVQVILASFMSFAPGENDVSNAIGPLAGVLSILPGGTSGAEIVIPIDVLAWEGFRIVAGLMMWGCRVIATIRKEISCMGLTEYVEGSQAMSKILMFVPLDGKKTLHAHFLVFIEHFHLEDKVDFEGMAML